MKAVSRAVLKSQYSRASVQALGSRDWVGFEMTLALAPSPIDGYNFVQQRRA